MPLWVADRWIKTGFSDIGLPHSPRYPPVVPFSLNSILSMYIFICMGTLNAYYGRGPQ